MKLSNKFVSISKAQLISFQHQALILKVLSGEIWLTKTGDTTDYCISAADGMMEIPMNSNIIIEALEDSLLRIDGHYSGQETEVRTALQFSKDCSINEADPTLPASAR